MDDDCGVSGWATSMAVVIEMVLYAVQREDNLRVGVLAIRQDIQRAVLCSWREVAIDVQDQSKLMGVL